MLFGENSAKKLRMQIKITLNISVKISIEKKEPDNGQVSRKNLIYIRLLQTQSTLTT